METEKCRACLLTDFGSTFTKISLINLDEATILGKSAAFTTVSTHVSEGFHQAWHTLTTQVDLSRVDIVARLACSSAGGGLKVIAIGLAPDYTVEAARRAALGAGARILKSYSYFLRAEDLVEIDALKPDIILLSGGENGGNKKCIIENARTLTRLSRAVPIVVAGNEAARDTIAEIFRDSGTKAYFTANVMPSIKGLNVLPVRAVIRRIFMDRIVEAKGMKEVAESFTNVIMPTPTAVLMAVELLSRGTPSQPGLGDVMAVDIGGATTDVHTVSEPIQDQSLLYDSLEEPLAKRTVEGDLGMRYSALSLYETLGEEAFQRWEPGISDIRALCEYRSRHPHFVAVSDREVQFDEVIAKNCVAAATLRHSGQVRRSWRSGHDVLVQSGKDLRRIQYVIGTGGVLVNSRRPADILRCSVLDQPGLLAPVSPELLLDERYLLSAMGLLSSIDPETALRILKKNLRKV